MLQTNPINQLKTLASLVFLSISLTSCSSNQPQNLKNINQILPTKSQGNEPGWQVLIQPNSIKINTNYNQDKFIFTDITIQKTQHSWILSAKNPTQLKLTYNRKTCLDDMTGMPYPWQVTLEITHQKLLGCGGKTQELLQGDWQVTQLNHQKILPKSQISLNFAAEKAYGFAGCNNYSTNYQLTGEGIEFNIGASTLKACPTKIMNQEDNFLKILNKINHLTLDKQQNLILTGANNLQIKAVKTSQ